MMDLEYLITLYRQKLVEAQNRGDGEEAKRYARLLDKLLLEE